MSRFRRWAILAVVSSGLLLISIDMTVLYTALPTLTSDLHASASEKLWIINAYPLVISGLLLGAGTLGDRIGHRRMFSTGLVVFGLASLLERFWWGSVFLINMPVVMLALVGSILLVSNWCSRSGCSWFTTSLRLKRVP